MKKVICDTNIWYGLGNKSIQKPENVKLVATWNNVMEIGFSHRAIKNKLDEEQVKFTAKAIIDFADEIINETPFHYVAKNLIHKLNLEVIDLKPIINQISTNGLADYSTYLHNKQAYDSFMKMKNDFHEEINSNKKELKISFKEISRTERKNEFLLGILVDIESFLRIEHNKEIEFEDSKDLKKTLKQIDEKFPLIFPVKDSFFELFTKQKSMKVQPNDYFDILNLYYVTENDFYWTKEKRWLNIIHECSLNNFLFTS
ncbi:hypothetical protein [Cyclobacterium jeungdonense]|uniref:DUF4935 domain-containing protein n=1 Tax=Cyclobacterium jeungdonense TaxID=708087 RepID=A0ABT8C623_9BACT|nr:hypothetical protein [Cyclobacterium jeungdonense]MDN3688238.1 hypothetical protein [Cyclobacterium jeungdonense]